ncbi:NfeD family protein [Spirulina sp. CCNP1310]|uniref:NfeD family protein n=1 Tax=Spirulina sp. CCNP1310 TaxID=3110249 RepID=UPI002B21AB1F|nr:NfeD family protein [Spirulina sp. CCNP1310]
MFSPTLLWFIAGAILCFMEVVFPTAFVEFIMGLAAIGVGLLAFILPFLPFPAQVLLWLVFTTGGIIFSRRSFTPKRRSRLLEDSRQGRTLTPIAPGELGRVVCDGNSWQARCEDETLAMNANTPVFIVRREGNTLIVLPQSVIQP